MLPEICEGVHMARLVAYDPFDVQSVNLHWYWVYGVQSQLVRGANVTAAGRTYQDVYWVEGNDGYDHLELDFYGTGITQDTFGNITGGSVGFVGEYDITHQSVLWFADGFSISALALYNAAQTYSNLDEIGLIQAAFAGDDTIQLSPYVDRMSGFAGNDTITGGAGADVLSGGGGNDTFQDTRAGLNGDTITDFGIGDKIILTDASLAGFTFTLSGNTLLYTGGAITLSTLPAGEFVATAAAGGGVQLAIGTAPPPRSVDNDFNGDGRSDILWRTSTGTIFNFLGTTNGGVINNGGNSSVAVDPAYSVAGLGDFNGDGRTDILWRNPTNGVVFNFLGTASGGFTSNGANSTVNVDNAYQVAGTGDFNGDGRTDILWRNSSTGVIFNFLGTASGGFSNNGDNSYVAVGTSTQVAGIGDFDGDGRSDILWRNGAGTIFNFLGTASGGYANNGGNSSVTVDNAWHIASTADFNGDNRADILWRNDAGVIFDFLGTASGGYSNNGDNSYVALSATTTVQDPFL